MYCIVSSSNRENNKSAIFSKTCEKIINELGEEVSFFSLNELPVEMKLNEIYGESSKELQLLSEKFILGNQKFIFVIPEYNGSFPGILKLFIDAVPPRFFKGKKACLVGVSAGFAGNLRGMDHFADILNYLDVTVMPKKLSIARIEAKVNERLELDSDLKDQLKRHLTRFLAF